MSEPKAVATGFETVVEGVHVWTVPDDRIGGAPSSAVAVEDGPGSVVLVNPLRLEEREFAKLGEVTAILLTSSRHVRAATHYRDVTGAAIWAPAAADLGDVEADETFTDGNEVPGELKVIAIEGPGGAESAFFLKRAGGVMIVGDALMNIAGFGGFQILPKQWNPDPAGTRQSCKKLLEYDFDVMLFGHGEPIRSGARQRLAQLLGR